jgi:CBS domain containing-hemolysin-like protein
VSLLPLLPVSRVPEEEPLHELLNLFQATGVHTALVTSSGRWPHDERVVGIVTLSDVMEELLQEKIADQTASSSDRYTDYVEQVSSAGVSTDCCLPSDPSS